MKKKIYLTLPILLMLIGGCVPPQTNKPIVIEYPKDVEIPKLTPYELKVISEKIYLNETSGDPEKLMFWSTNENFASLGIGHFIWYPDGEAKRFDETFPAMIDYYVANKVEVPAWLLNARKVGAPWKNRASFEYARKDKQFIDLKYLLMNTKELQTQFFFDRLHASIPEILLLVEPSKREHIKNNYNALAKTQGGWYPLIDYINFKGKGLKDTERYNNQGWGLLQVLEHMPPVQSGSQALVEFSNSSRAILEQRVKNSPPQNNEAQWLPGWINRTNSYKTPIL
ncbi:MAG: hypothetical protein IE878_03130 [Epsilonproteobacteria bacterium]|nr:hypothetical protein [Campylobacterota bacterium]MBD3839365.1 hypothetical protein [Campylobacterota bacterium]